MSNEITNDMNVIDSRDIIKRIEELEYEFENYKSIEGNENASMNEWAEIDCDGDELISLLSLAEEGEQYSDDWEYGAQLIRESYFEDYMDEMVEDLGDIPRNLPSYLTIRVDYDALKMDYTEVEFDGQTYFIR